MTGEQYVFWSGIIGLIVLLAYFVGIAISKLKLPSRSLNLFLKANAWLEKQTIFFQVVFVLGILAFASITILTVLKAIV